MLEIYNTLTGKKAPFEPIDPKNVRLYVCGMTVYDLCHLGHARVLVVFDVVNRYLRHVFGDEHVTYIRNITDIDDKIIARANENKEPFEHLTERFINEMTQDADALAVQHPNQEPRATGHMQQIIDMVVTLIEKDHAYVADNGDVYYSVNSFANYGALSKKQLEDLQSGARVEVNQDKRDPLDFVLWKAAKPGEPSWDSPWGKGRPGWHIECSAMSTHCLGDHFDIHGGGSDLQFPHHENEIAQSEAANGCSFANTWIHTGMVQVDKEKMSKSLNNFFTIREVLALYRAESVRYFMLSSHYRSQLNYSEETLKSADASLERLYLSLRDIELENLPEAGSESEHIAKFRLAMDDDFNTPEAMAVLFDLAREINRAKTDDIDKARQLAADLIALGGVLGILQQTPEAFLKSSSSGDEGDDARIDQLIVERNQARADKNWARADEIRDQLQAEGIVLEDKAGETVWRRD